MASMSGKFQHLKPGALITADLMNSILDALNSLDARLAAAEKRLAKRARPALRRAGRRSKSAKPEPPPFLDFILNRF
jgi:hypothetical protein